MKYDNQIMTNSNYDKTIDGFKCPDCNEPLNIDGLLSMYGPEGLYELAELLMKVADEDVSDSMK